MQKVTFDSEFEFILINDDIASLEESEALIPKDGIRLIPKGIRYRFRAFMYDLNWRSFFASLVLWVSYLLCNAGYSTIGPFFPQEAMNKGASPSSVGFIISSSPLCVALLSPLCGYLLPLVRVSFITFVGLLLVGVSFLLLGFVMRIDIPGVFILVCVTLRLIEGVGSAMFTTAMFSTFPKLFPHSIGTMMGLFQVAAGLGYGLGRPVGALLYTWGGYKLPFVVVGGSAIIFSFLCFFLVGNMTIEKKKSTLSRGAICRVTTDILFISLALVMVTIYAANSYISPLLEPFLIQQFNLNHLQISLIYFIAPTVYAVLNIPAGAIADKLRSKYIIILGLIITATGDIFLGATNAKHLWIVYVSFVLFGIGGAISIVPVYGNLIMVAKRYVSNDKDVALMSAYVSGVLSSALSMGEFIGPLVGGLLGDFLTFPAITLIIGEFVIAETALLYGVSLIVSYTRKKPEEHDL